MKMLKKLVVRGLSKLGARLQHTCTRGKRKILMNTASPPAVMGVGRESSHGSGAEDGLSS